MTDAEATIDKLRGKSAELEGQLTGAEATIDKLRGKNAELEGQLTGAEATIAELRGESAELKGQLTGAEATIGELERRVTDLKSENAKFKGMVEELQVKLARAKGDSPIDSLASTGDVINTRRSHSSSSIQTDSRLVSSRTSAEATAPKSGNSCLTTDKEAEGTTSGGGAKLETLKNRFDCDAAFGKEFSNNAAN